MTWLKFYSLFLRCTLVAGTFHFLWRRVSTLARVCLAIRPSSSLTDYKSPRLTAKIAGTLLPGAIVDGGSGINLMPEYTMVALGLQTTRPAHFSVTLADQRSVSPVGIVEKVPLEIQGFTFLLDFVVVRLPKVPGGFPLLIGRPWLRHAKAIHDWGSDQLWIFPQDSPRKELILEPDIDPSAQGASLNIHPSTDAQDPVPEHSEDTELIDWMEAAESISCLMVLITEPSEESSEELEPLGSTLTTSSVAQREPTTTEPKEAVGLGEPEPIEAVGLGEPITDRRRGKKSPHTGLPLHSSSDPSSSPDPSLPPTPIPSTQPSPVSATNDLPFEELPAGWLQEKYGDFPIDQEPAHDVITLERAAASTEDIPLPSCEDPVKEVNLGTTDHPKPILLASWLWDQPILLAQVISFMKSYQDVFAWSYQDLEGIPPEIGVHTIPLVEGTRPVYQGRAYKLNPKYAEAVKLELEKMEAARIIVPVEHTEWLSPMVISPKKKSNKIRVCVDFRALNKSTIKDGFPTPFTERVLEDVAGHALYSFMDGFSGYNQVAIHPVDQLKTAFVTPWGTFIYTKMAFRSSECSALLQPGGQPHIRAFAPYLPQSLHG